MQDRCLNPFKEAPTGQFFETPDGIITIRAKFFGQEIQQHRVIRVHHSAQEAREVQEVREVQDVQKVRVVREFQEVQHVQEVHVYNFHSEHHLVWNLSFDSVQLEIEKQTTTPNWLLRTSIGCRTQTVAFYIEFNKKGIVNSSNRLTQRSTRPHLSILLLDTNTSILSHSFNVQFLYPFSSFH